MISVHRQVKESPTGDAEIFPGKILEEPIKLPWVVRKDGESSKSNNDPWSCTA